MNSWLFKSTFGKVIIGLIVFAVLVVLLVSTGILKLSFKFTKGGANSSDQNSPSSNQKSPTTLAPRGIRFGGADGQPELEIFPPIGWIRGESSAESDLTIGSSLNDTLGNGVEFTPNIQAKISGHGFGEKSIEDYEKNWNEVVIKYLPSIEISKSYRATVNGLSAFVQERILPRPDGEKIRQLHYKFFLNQKYSLALTGSVPEASWEKSGGQIKASIESVKLLSPGTLPEEASLTPGPESSSSADLLTYANSLYKISINYPKLWEKKENTESALVSFSSPTKESLNIVIYDNADKNAGLEAYTTEALKAVEGLKGVIENSGSTTLANRPAYEVVYTISNDIKVRQIWAVEKGRAYLLTFAARTINYSDFEATAQIMIDSFRIN